MPRPYCANCDASMTPGHPGKKYCSLQCKRQSRAKRRVRNTPSQRRSNLRWNIRQELADNKVRYFRRCPSCDRRFKTKQTDKSFCSTRCTPAEPSGQTEISYASCLNCEHVFLPKANTMGKCPRCWYGTIFVKICAHCSCRIRPDGRNGPRLCLPCLDAQRKTQKQQARRRRRARKSNSHHTPYTKLQLIERDGNQCWICEDPMDLTWDGQAWQPRYATIDHIIPISRGGDDTPANAKLAHWECNSERSDNIHYDQLVLATRGG